MHYLNEFIELCQFKLAFVTILVKKALLKGTVQLDVTGIKKIDSKRSVLKTM
jgi:hypothetical protein